MQKNKTLPQTTNQKAKSSAQSDSSSESENEEVMNIESDYMELFKNENAGISLINLDSIFF